MATSNIPSVTPQDLTHFHQKHFGSRAEQHPSQNDVCDADDLGYYEDGYKRTLTDDQIAMFRHSEIQTILRARRHKREAEECDGSDHHDQAPSLRDHLQEQNIIKPRQRKKTKRNEIQYDPDSSHAATTTDFLDYGDEPISSSISHSIPGRKIVSYADVEHSSASERNNVDTI
ncbi:MAG: hypothetical protein M1834_002748 [Cirrosporium novae-zelandiae]|nr:MAG: hypothetical protein M1834_002748 [Cirrosporium novae-zelandiae]